MNRYVWQNEEDDYSYEHLKDTDNGVIIAHLTEPEDRCSYRDLDPITRLLNEQDQRIKDLEEALLWYADTVSDCNRSSKAGEEARNKLAKDVGRMAKNVLEDLEG
jgi:hypothetical protein